MNLSDTMNIKTEINTCFITVIWLTRNEVLNNNIVFTIQSGFINQNTNVVSHVLDFAI